MRRFLVALTLVLVCSLPAAAATFTVDDLGDADDGNLADNLCDTGGGVCTLRAAIEQANATAGADTIDFDVAGTISPATAFDAITEEVEISGIGAPGYLGAPVVILDGTDTIAVGLDVADGGSLSRIAGLQIYGFTEAGIRIAGDEVEVRECYIGPIGGGTPNLDGIVITETSTDAVIGGGDNGGNIISGNEEEGIWIEGDSAEVQDNWIGLDTDGVTPLQNGDAGILLSATADGNEIGTFFPDERNVISGNFNEGIRVEDATNTTIYGNYIGTDSTGMIDVPNELDGVGLYGATGTAVGISDGGNVISGNFFDGIYSEDSTGTTVVGNIIGLDSFESAALPNGQHGINVDSGQMTIGSTIGGNIITGNFENGILVSTLDTVTIVNNIIGLDSGDNIIGNGVYGIAVGTGGVGDTTIGGTNEGEGNTISGNFFAGISIFFSSGVGIYGNSIGLTFDRSDTRGNGSYGIEMLLSEGITIGSAGAGMNVISGNSASGIDHVSSANVTITGNRIGTDGTGMTALGNLEAGVEICDATSGVQVTDNLISGNGEWGVWLMSDATGNTVSDNIIGLNADQSGALPNADAGVLITDTAAGNTIGPDNVISGNSRNGVAVTDTAIDNVIEGNSIFDNGELGIDLGGDFLNTGDGVTLNDDDDPDTGPNGLQNFPVLSAAPFNGTNTSIQGTLNSLPDTTFTVHFYENTAVDQSGFGEGQTPLGSTSVTTDSNGDAAFIFNGPATTLGNFITSTATGPDDGTSEFSAPVTVTAAPTVQFTSATYSESEGAGTVTLTLTRSGDLTGTSIVDFTTADDTALTGSDYTGGTGSMTFAPGDDTETFTIPLTDDASDEPAETFDVTLSNPNGASLGAPSAAEVTITDNDNPPLISIDDVAESEGNAGTTAFNFTVSLSAPSAFTVTVDVATADNSAVEPGDYTAVTTTTLTFDPGETTQPVTVNANGDLTFEGDETFFVDLSSPSNATIDDGQGTGTILDDDGPPLITIDNVNSEEGNAGTTAFNFTVSLSHPSDTTVTVDYETADGTAVAGTDYTAVPVTQISFAPGDTSEPVTVNVSGDLTFEGNDTFTVNLSNASGGTIDAGKGGTGTIINDDFEPEISIDDVTLNEGDAGTTSFTFTLSLSNASDSTVTVTAATADDSATAGSDYTGDAGSTVTFDPGETTQQYTVDVSGDVTFEGDETFFVNLTVPSNATIDDNQGLGTITNDDGQPEITIDDVTLNEGDAGTTSFTFTISLSNPSASIITLTAATSDGSAAAGSDFTADAGTTITFNPGETTQPYTVSVSGDVTFEGDETFFVDLSGATNATIEDNQGLGTITDDDGQPEITIDNVALNEGNAGTTPFTFTVSLSHPSDTTITVDAATADGTATEPDDYTAVGTTTLTFDPGETTQPFTVNVNGDTTTEGGENFFVDLDNATGATITDSQGAGIIADDDGAPELTIDDVTLAEGDAGTTVFTFTVSLSNPINTTVTVDAETSNGSAGAGSDYTAVATTTLTFDPTETTQQFTVNVSGDTTFEGDETFFVDLSNPTGGATIGDDQGTGTINNDDGQPEISIDDVSLNEGDAGTTPFVFTVSLSNPSASTVTVVAQTANLTAEGDDYTDIGLTTVTFDPGETSQQVTVNVNGDIVFEANETFVVGLSAPTNATIADNSGTGTILDDDGAPVISIDDVSMNEGDAGNTIFTFTVSLSHPSDSLVMVDYDTADGTASSTSDYIAASANLAFSEGDLTEQITVIVTGDVLHEADETFFVNLSNPSGATIDADAGSGTGTIVNDDAPPAISIGDGSQLEGDAGTTPMTFSVTLSGPSDSTITVEATTADGSAAAGSDYTAQAATTITFDPGETSQDLPVDILGDTITEGAEDFTVTLDNATVGTIDDGQATGTILDDETTLISIDDVTLAEGDAGTTVFTFTVSLSTPSDSTVTVQAATANGSATAGSDYTAVAATTITFDPGETTQQFTVDVAGDDTAEGDETFFVNLSAASGATIADNQGLGTITNDDATPSIVISDVTLDEGDAGITAFLFTLTLSNPSASTVTVNAATENNSALAGSDYNSASGVVTFNPGVTSQQFSVDVLGETVFESAETFFVNLTGAVNATIADPQATGTITDDDPLPSLTISDVTQAEGDAGTTTFTFDVVLSNPSDFGIGVDFATEDLTATAGADYTAVATTRLSISPGSTSATIEVSVLGDTIVESDEVFIVRLSNVQNATIADDEGRGTIDEDDVLGSANLSMNKTAPVTYIPGEALTFTLTVRNDGPDAATNVTVTDTLPANTTFVSATSATASCSGTTTVICTIATLANGATATITLTVNPTGNDDITNTASVSAAEGDVNGANNTDSVVVGAAPPGTGATIPTASEWGLLLLALGLAVVAAVRMRA